MEGRRIIPRGLRAVIAAIAMATVAAPGAGASQVGASEPMLVQPDGRIVLTGRLWPSFAALARLTPDGRPDPSFGSGGFVVDRRLAALSALAQRPDGRIVAAGPGGFRLVQYLSNGEPDPAFAGGGVGGTEEPDQIGRRYFDYGPNAVVLQPGGEIVVAGTRGGGGGPPQGLVKRYDPNGGLLETVGSVPGPAGEPPVESHLDGLVANPDGSLVGAGWAYASGVGDTVLLARFMPGSGTDLDRGFGGGAGLVREAFERAESFPTEGNALERDGDKLLVAGRTAGKIMVSRFGQDGMLDKSFGQGGFTAPTVPGAAAPSPYEARSWANDIAATGAGTSVVVGGSSAWGDWRRPTKSLPVCTECPQPLIARFTATGQLDPGFGEGGVLRLRRPDGSLLEGEAEQVAVLGSGKLLVSGVGRYSDAEAAPRVGGVSVPFVARLNSDGSYDPSFGEGGLTVLVFPCTEGSRARLRAQGCYPSTRLRLRLSGRPQRPRLSFEVSPSLTWARLGEVGLELPPGLQPRKGFKSRARVLAVGGTEGTGTVHLMKPKEGRRGRHLLFDDFGEAESLRVTLLPGALRRAAPATQRRFRFRVTAYFVKEREKYEYAGWQTVARRVGLPGR